MGVRARRTWALGPASGPGAPKVSVIRDFGDRKEAPHRRAAKKAPSERDVVVQVVWPAATAGSTTPAARGALVVFVGGRALTAGAATSAAVAAFTATAAGARTVAF